MDIGFVAYDGMTALDFVGVYDPVTRLGTMGFRDDVAWEVCARTETVTATGPLPFVPTAVAGSLDGYDVVIVPGGFAARDLAEDDDFVAWLRTAAPAERKVSVCTGSLLLGAAGFLDGRTATTHPSAYDLLAEYCEVTRERVVEDGPVVTARGVSSSIDLGLYLVEVLDGRETRQAVAEQMDYPYGE